MSRFHFKLQRLPDSGGDLHSAINAAVLVGLHEGISPEEVAESVIEAAEGKGRSYSQLFGEVWRTVRSALTFLGRKSVAEPMPAALRKRVCIDYKAVERIAYGYPSLRDLETASEAAPDNPEELLARLFPLGSWTCCGWSPSRFETRRLEQWFGQTDNLQFIVPNPMRAKFGMRKDGGLSQRCNDNVATRRFQVIEFDFKPSKGGQCQELLMSLRSAGYTVEDLNAALHLHLQKFLPLALAVHSGGSSIHGWYRCAGIAESELQKFQNYAAKLGADPALFAPSQFTRFPNGRRCNGALQRVLYFNPEVLP